MAAQGTGAAAWLGRAGLSCGGQRREPPSLSWAMEGRGTGHSGPQRRPGAACGSGEGLGRDWAWGRGRVWRRRPEPQRVRVWLVGTGGEASAQEPRSPGDHGGHVGAVRRRGRRSSESRAARSPAPRAWTPGGGQAASAGTCRSGEPPPPHAACSVGSASRSGHSFQPPRLRERSAQPGGPSRLRVPVQRPPGRGRGHRVVPASALRLLPRDSPRPPRPPQRPSLSRLITSD